MKTRIENNKKEILKNNFSDTPLYTLLRSICPAYERSLQSVRPCTEEIMLESLEIFNNILALDEAEANAYCRGLWDDIYCQWRDVTEHIGRVPTDNDLNATVALILYSTRTLLALTGQQELLVCASIIDIESDKKSRESWQAIENTFQPHIARSLRDGLQDWVNQHINNPESILQLSDDIPENTNITHSTIRLSPDIDKIELLRIINAMCEYGFFYKTDIDKKADKKDVFAAFAQMLGDPRIAKYSTDLNRAKDPYCDPEVNTRIFDALRDKSKEYFAK